MGIRIYSISGRYYGYPPCCIEAFNKEQHKVNRIKRKLSVQVISLVIYVIKKQKKN